MWGSGVGLIEGKGKADDSGRIHYREYSLTVVFVYDTNIFNEILFHALKQRNTAIETVGREINPKE